MADHQKDPGTSEGRSASSPGMDATTAQQYAVARSFDDFYRNHRDTLVRVLVLTLGSVDLAADAADEAMARAFQRWKTVSTVGSRQSYHYCEPRTAKRL